MNILCQCRIVQLRLRHTAGLPALQTACRRQGILSLIRDPSISDLNSLAEADLPLEGLVVALEIRPVLPDGERLLRLHRQVLQHLQPQEATPAIGRQRRWLANGHALCLGGPEDAVELRCYPRLSADGAPLPPDRQSSRIDLVLRTAACRKLGLHRTADLPRFNFRHALGPYFFLNEPDPADDTALAWHNPNRSGHEALRRLTQRLRHHHA